jgi:hypothetical protein
MSRHIRHFRRTALSASLVIPPPFVATRARGELQAGPRRIAPCYYRVIEGPLRR